MVVARVWGGRGMRSSQGSKPWGRAFQALGTASAKALRWDKVWSDQRTARRYVYLKESDEGESGGR